MRSPSNSKSDNLEKTNFILYPSVKWDTRRDRKGPENIYYCYNLLLLSGRFLT